MQTKSRDGSLDLLRVLASVMIMLCHSSMLYGMGNTPFFDTQFFSVTETVSLCPFFDAWIYVEFFLIVTGYLTAKHFFNFETGTESAVTTSMKYTLHKFSRIFCYSATATLIGCVLCIPLLDHSVHSYIALVEQFLYESLYLCGGLGWSYILPTSWYLCGLFVMFPLFCLSLASKQLRDFTYYILSWLFPVLFYGFVGIIATSGNQAPGRILAGLYLGVVVFMLVNYRRQCTPKKYWRGLVTAAEVVTILLPIYLCYIHSPSKRLILICFVVCLFCVFSGDSYIQFPSNKFTVWLGADLSLSMYLLHFYVFRTFSKFTNLRFRYRLLLAIAATVAASCALTFVFNRLFWKRKKAAVSETA